MVGEALTFTQAIESKVTPLVDAALSGELIMQDWGINLRLVANEQPGKTYFTPFLMRGRFGIELCDEITDAPVAICSFDFFPMSNANVAISVVHTPQGMKPGFLPTEVSSAARHRLVSMDYNRELLNPGTIAFCKRLKIAPFRVNMLRALRIFMLNNDVRTMQIISSRNHSKSNLPQLNGEPIVKLIDEPAVAIGCSRGVDGNWWIS